MFKLNVERMDYNISDIQITSDIEFCHQILNVYHKISNVYHQILNVYHQILNGYHQMLNAYHQMSTNRY